MIPYPYNMVDMGGIDLAEANGTVVEGLYNRLILARNACGDLILYNWKFVGIEIVPSACSTIDEGTSIVINGMIEVTDEDVVIIITLEPEPPVIEQLTVTENGTYSAPAGIDGYSPVHVDVSQGSVVIFHPGRLRIDTGEITESDEYCYSDLIPVISGSYHWFIDLTRDDTASYSIGISFFAEDGVTCVGYIRQYQAYRSYSEPISSNAKFIRIANKLSNMSFANMSFASVSSQIDNIFVVPSNATILINEEE